MTHPLATLTREELRGWIACSRHMDAISVRLGSFDHAMLVMEELQEVAQGLLDRAMLLGDQVAARRAVAHPAPAIQVCREADAECIAGCTFQQDGLCGLQNPQLFAGASDEQQQRAAGTYRETEPASQPQAQRWYRLAGTEERFASLAEAMATCDDDARLVESSEWSSPRWAVHMARDHTGDVFALADTEEEARAFLLGETEEEIAQTGLADAVAENLAEQPPTASEMNASLAAQEAAEAASPIQSEATPPTAAERSADASRQRAQRSDSPWTDERVALLRRLFPTIMHVDRLLGLLNAMPGLPIPSANAIGIKARKLDIHRRGEPIPEEYADAPNSRSRQPQMAAKAAPAAEPPKPTTPIVTTAFIPLTTEEMHNLRESFRKKEFGVSWLAEEYGMPPDEAQKIVNQLREEQAQKKAKAA
jgi:hypothetical protein